MSHKTPSKTDFSDDFRYDASCLEAAKEDPSLQTAWDNVDHGTWAKDDYRPDENASTARHICFACPVRRKCIDDALADNEAEGIRGGFRFENGYMSKEDSRKLWQEYRLRGKVRKTSRTSVKTTEV